MIPQLQSLPGAPHSLYLWFDGGGAKPAFFHKDAATTEADIREMWAIVAEAYSPFNVNVTTIPTIGAHVIAVGGDVRGYAYVGDWPGLGWMGSDGIFQDNPALNVPDAVVCARGIIHEAGHGAGLEHQSLFDGAGGLVNPYNYGDCPYKGAPCTLSPLMGGCENTKHARWWEGRNELGAIQNDVNVLANRFGWRPSSIGTTFGSATPLGLTPLRPAFAVAGVIRFIADAHCWSFDGAGGFSVELRLASHGPTFNPRMELRDSGNNTIVVGLWDGAVMRLNTTLTAGSYVLVIASAAATVGDIGQYTLFGSVDIVPILPKTEGQRLHDTHGFYFTGDFHPNWLGLGEKWFRGNPHDLGGDWYFITPQGSVVAWGNGSRVIGNVSPAHFHRPRLMFSAPWTVQDAFGLHVPAGGHLHNDLGCNEDWWLGDANWRANPWYYVLPNGKLFAWNGDPNVPDGTYLCDWKEGE